MNPHAPALTPAASAPSARGRRGGVAAGYAKGDASRQRLLAVAMTQFAELGFRAATTRRIAAAAGVQLPAIGYYFGHKEGLYLACAEAIVEGYEHHMAAAAEQARAALGRGGTPDAQRAALQGLMQALVELLMGHPDARRWAAFIARETADPGPAYEVLYQRVWAPGTALTARLIGALRGQARPGADERLQAMLLIGGVMSLQSGSRVSRRLLDWDTVGPAQQRLIVAALHQQIERLAAGR